MSQKFKPGDFVWYTGRGRFSRASRVGKIGVVQHAGGRDTGVAVKFDGETFVEEGILEENLAHLGKAPKEDVINHPKHYTSHPSGVECITITEHMSFTLGNAIKYIWRADLKDDAIEDLKKARFYIDREIARREAAK